MTGHAGGAARGRGGRAGSRAGGASRAGGVSRAGAGEAVTPRPVRPGRPGDALGHPLRVALLGLLSRRATLTATEAARELRESSGACSFHLRQLERYGHIEAVPGARGRVRPWRLATADAGPGSPPGAAGSRPAMTSAPWPANWRTRGTAAGWTAARRPRQAGPTPRSARSCTSRPPTWPTSPSRYARSSPRSRPTGRPAGDWPRRGCGRGGGAARGRRGAHVPAAARRRPAGLTAAASPRLPVAPPARRPACPSPACRRPACPSPRLPVARRRRLPRRAGPPGRLARLTAAASPRCCPPGRAAGQSP